MAKCAIRFMKFSSRIGRKPRDNSRSWHAQEYRFCYSCAVSMAKSQNSRSAARVMRCLLISLSLCALTGSLVTRTFHLKVPQCITAQSNSPHAVRQHLDRDAVQWAAPVQNFALLSPSAFRSSMAIAATPLPSVILDDSLYNRPPPSC